MTKFQESIDIYPIILIPESIIKGATYQISIEEVSKKNPEKEIDSEEVISRMDFSIKHQFLLPVNSYRYEKRTRLIFNNKWIDFILSIFCLIGCLVVLKVGYVKGLNIIHILIILFLGYHFFIWFKDCFQFKEYTEHVRIPELEYTKLVHEYEKKKKEYNTKYNQEYKKLEAIIKKEKQKSRMFFLKNKRLELIKQNKLQSLKAKTKIKRFDNPDVIKKGKSELMFLRVLLKFFSENIRTNIATESYPQFYPDFVYICQDTGLCLDIEIDEPYDYESKIPIHYKGGKDEQRNKYFLANNWLVIRFTEKQVLNFPEECCKFIRNIVECIKSNKTYNIPNSIEKEKRWTYEESLLMIEDNLRG